MLSRAEIDRREVIYLISDGEAVKIGVTSDIARRLKILKSELRCDLRVIKTWPCRYAREVERIAHAVLIPFQRIRPERPLEREWFFITADDAVSTIEIALKRLAGNRRRI